MCSLSIPSSTTLSTGFLVKPCKAYPGVQVGTDVHISDPTYAVGIVLLSNSYREMQSLLETVNHRAAAVDVRINASKTKVMTVLIPGEQHQIVLHDCEPSEDIGKLKNRQVTEGTGSRINLARSAFSQLQSCLWLKCEISVCTKVRASS